MNIMRFLSIIILLFISISAVATPEEQVRKEITDEAIKSSIEEGTTKLRQVNNSTATYCPPWQKPNRFAAMRDNVEKHCIFLGITNDACSKLVEDTFEVASPHCPEGDISKEATNCTMLSKYIADQFSKAPDKYMSYLTKASTLIAQNGSNSMNLYEIILKSTDGNKNDAIFMMGLLIFNQPVVSDLYKSGKYDDAIKISQFLKQIQIANPNVKATSLPPEFENLPKSKQAKAYHFWTRAFLANQLKQKGHSSLVARSVATSTSAYYEFAIDWEEHKAQGMTVENRFKNAISDVLFSDEGSKFGVTE